MAKAKNYFKSIKRRKITKKPFALFMFLKYFRWKEILRRDIFMSNNNEEARFAVTPSFVLTHSSDSI